MAERIGADEAQRLVSAGRVRVLDVRTPEEYEQLGHIPGARLLPVDLAACAPAVLERDRPWLVCCEHGVRSAHAARLLEQAGFDGVLDLAGGMSCWSGPREHAPGRVEGPSPWLLECADLLPPPGAALDVACGRGRHALLLAAAGFDVLALDRDPDALAELERAARGLALTLRAECCDLEAPAVDLGARRYDLIVVVHYLHRPLVPALLRSLAPGGLLLYETFTTAQARRGRPTNPAFLLRPGELRALVAPLRVVREREGELDGRDVAAVAAFAPAA